MYFGLSQLHDTVTLDLGPFPLNKICLLDENPPPSRTFSPPFCAFLPWTIRPLQHDSFKVSFPIQRLAASSVLQLIKNDDPVSSLPTPQPQHPQQCTCKLCSDSSVVCHYPLFLSPASGTASLWPFKTPRQIFLNDSLSTPYYPFIHPHPACTIFICAHTYLSICSFNPKPCSKILRKPSWDTLHVFVKHVLSIPLCLTPFRYTFIQNPKHVPLLSPAPHSAFSSLLPIPTHQPTKSNKQRQIHLSAHNPHHHNPDHASGEHPRHRPPFFSAVHYHHQHGLCCHRRQRKRRRRRRPLTRKDGHRILQPGGGDHCAGESGAGSDGFGEGDEGALAVGLQ